MMELIRTAPTVEDSKRVETTSLKDQGRNEGPRKIRKTKVRLLTHNS